MIMITQETIMQINYETIKYGKIKLGKKNDNNISPSELELT